MSQLVGIDLNKNEESAKELLTEIIGLLNEMSDENIGNLWTNEQITALLLAISNLRKIKDYPKIADFLLANKNRSATIATIRQLITQNFCIGVKKVKRGIAK